MSSLALYLLGDFRISLDGNSLDLPGKKTQALLIYLAAESAAAHRREDLMNLLWPGMPERSARQNLRQVTYSLRQAIPAVPFTASDSENDTAPLLLANRQTIQLHPSAAVAVDTGRFDALLERALDHEHGDLLQCQACREDLQAAVEMYHGDFLQDFYLDDSEVFAEWSQIRREHHRRQILDALDTLTRMAVRREDFTQARLYAERQLTVDNLRERAYQQLMEILALSGRREEAVAVYEDFRSLLAEELGMAPASRTTDLYKQIMAGDLRFDIFPAKGVHGYELKDQIGEGAYGAIHLAVQPSIGREVAVKIISRKHTNDPEFIRRFEAEAQTVAGLEHPFIVPLYDYWRDPDGAYLIMRYLRGGSLLSALEQGPWDLQTSLIMLEQVAGALSVAHNHGVIHRDIKPANILLDELGNAYLSDFGIAKDLTEEMQLTIEGAIVGTPDYISPEQIRNEQVSPQTDLYSLGAVLYETLTGEKPFPDSSLSNLIYQHLNEPVPLVSASRPDTPPAVDKVIQRATAKRPSDRYASALEMADAYRSAVSENRLVVVPEASMRAAVTEIYNPYKGLRAFQEADADDFFGREELADRLIERLSASRFLAIVGPSGSGKSSVVKAGLIPALRNGAIPGSEKWFVAEMTPGTHPLEELELALWPIAVDPPPSLVDPMQRDSRGILRTLRRILPAEKGMPEEGTQLLLVIDQFEELFTLVEDPARRTFFLDSLLIALNDPRSPLRVVITLRADFFDRPLQNPALGQLLREKSEIVLPLGPTELTWAVRDPALRVGVSLEEGLSEAIVADVADQPGALPLLQYALTELFERREGRQMTRQAYDEIGGVAGALGNRAEEIYASLDTAGQEAARQLFLRLVTLGEGAEDTRRRVLIEELNALEPASYRQGSGSSDLSSPNTGDPIKQVLDLFGSARLLTFDNDPITRGPTVEVAHEALLREWSRMRGWLDKSRNDIRLQRLLATAVAEWKAANQDEGYLLRGTRLDQFAGWAEDSSLALTTDEVVFLESSVAARQKREAQELERQQRELETAQQLAETERARAEEQEAAAAGLRRRAAILAGVLVAALVLALTALFFARQSNANAQIADENAARAQENALLAATREAEAVVEAEQRAAAQAEAERESRRADEQRDAAILAQEEAQSEAQFRATAEALAIEERQEALRQASVGLASQAELQRIGSRPERAVLLALEAVENYPYTWQAERALGQAVLGHHLVADLDHGEYVNHADISPDGTRLVTGADDGVAKVWDIASGELIHTLEGHENWVFRVFWSPSGDRILTAASDGTARIWDADSGEEIFFLDPGGFFAYWSPDGARVVTSRQPDDEVTIWDAASGERLFTITGHEERTWAVDSWSPDGERIATGGRDGTARVWDTATGEELLTLSGHEGAVILTSFSPEGDKLLTSGFDGTARIWDANTGEELFNFAGHDGMPAAKWSPSGDRVLTQTGTLLRVWDAVSGEELLALSAPADFYANWSPDGNLIVAGGEGGEIKLWNAVTGDVVQDFVGHDGWLAETGWSPDGSFFWTSGGDGHAKVWQRSNNISTLYAEDQASDWPSEPAWSPSGDKIARGYTGAVTIWDAASKSEIQTLSFEPAGEGSPEIGGRPGVVLPLVWSPVDDRILAGDSDGYLRMWDTTSGEELLTLPAHDDLIWDAAWSPDGERLVTASEDGTARVWNAETGELLETFDEHVPLSVSWSPDGRTIASASLDNNSAKIWDAETGEVLRDLFPQDFAFPVSTAVWSPDGSKIATFSLDTVGRIWDAWSGEELLTFSGVTGEPQVSWSPSGDYLLTSGDSGAQVWDAHTGNQVLPLTNDAAVSANWSPDGKYIALSDLVDGKLEVHPMWRSLEDLVAIAKDCCIIGALSAEERARFGLEDPVISAAE